jgi:predicted HAD superfamily Cof-like phosphohydrolase
MTIRKVQKFHQKFDLADGTADVLCNDQNAIDFRVGFMIEELTEFEEAIKAGNNVDAFDALLDLAYVVFGTALMAGISPEQWDAGFTAVQRANMTKVRCENASKSKRGSSLDVRKPDGWVGPEKTLQDILHGANLK